MRRDDDRRAGTNTLLLCRLSYMTRVLSRSMAGIEPAALRLRMKYPDASVRPIAGMPVQRRWYVGRLLDSNQHDSMKREFSTVEVSLRCSALRRARHDFWRRWCDGVCGCLTVRRYTSMVGIFRFELKLMNSVATVLQQSLFGCIEE